MADEDFEIDVYGDANDNNDATTTNADDSNHESSNTHAYDSNSSITIANGSSNPDSTTHTQHTEHDEYDSQEQHTMDYRSSATPSQGPQGPQQGTKRKEGSDDRPIDPGATSALLVSELQWWNTDDDVRSWTRRASCEEELKDITFSEHKVNGKSKGQAYIEFTSQQAATAVKRQLEAIVSEASAQPSTKKMTVIYTSPTINPFKTLPKDAPARANKDGATRGGSNAGGYNDRGGFRGRGSFNGPRGGFNRNFNNSMGGGGGGGFHGNPGGFNNNMGGGNFGFNNMGGGGGGNFGFRGGMVPNMRGGGMRGGRGGGMNPGMSPGMNAAGMNNMMGNGMGMGMPMMGFQQPAHFNPAFFGGNQQSEWQNPHGAKRPREN